MDCWMEIQAGKGPWAPPVSGIVPLGSTLTLVVAINDYRGEGTRRTESEAVQRGLLDRDPGDGTRRTEKRETIQTCSIFPCSRR